jgi:threonine/homoserine/homoserine lactone efflux protein
MDTFPFTIVIGFVVGFLGAIPPGPLNVSVIRKASSGDRRAAYRVALGGALVDVLLCGAIALGFGWALDKLVTKQWIKASLALFLVGYGLKVAILDPKREAERDAERALEGKGTDPLKPRSRGRMPVLVGFLQGAANPTLIVNWTFLISVLVGHRLIRPTIPAGAGFALGIGLGVFAWFALLITLLKRFHDHPIGAWLRRSTVYAGVLLILFGVYFTIRTFFVFEG